MSLFGKELSLPIVLGLVLSILVTLATIAGAIWLDGFNVAKQRSAIVFQRTLDAANKEADRREQEALDAAEEVAPTPTTDAELVSLCKRDRAACRDNKG